MFTYITHVCMGEAGQTPREASRVTELVEFTCTGHPLVTTGTKKNPRDVPVYEFLCTRPKKLSQESGRRSPGPAQIPVPVRSAFLLLGAWGCHRNLYSHFTQMLHNRRARYKASFRRKVRWIGKKGPLQPARACSSCNTAACDLIKKRKKRKRQV